MLRTIALISAAAAISAGVAIPAVSLAGGDEPTPVVTAPRMSATPAAPTKAEVIQQVSRGVVQISGAVGDARAGGTGVVIDAAKGLIATNAHVVSGMSSIEVALPDRSRVAGRLVASSPCDDLAVIQITPSQATATLAFSTGPSAAGDDVMAFGFPTSFEAGETQTVKVTEGMVSAVNVVSAPDASLPEYKSTIQHQAPISPGNSGGPLVDAAGRVVGINTLGNSGRSGEVQGQYYAISATEAQAVLADLREGRSRTDIGLDLVPLSAVNLEEMYSDGAEVREQFEAAGYGEALFVRNVRTGSPAAEAGIEAGDVLTSLEGTSTDEVRDVCGALKSHSAGDRLEAELVVLGSDSQRYGEGYTATLTLAGSAQTGLAAQ
jgi:S1-C subfamily serine protease